MFSWYLVGIALLCAAMFVFLIAKQESSLSQHKLIRIHRRTSSRTSRFAFVFGEVGKSGNRAAALQNAPLIASPTPRAPHPQPPYPPPQPPPFPNNQPHPQSP